MQAGDRSATRREGQHAATSKRTLNLKKPETPAREEGALLTSTEKTVAPLKTIRGNQAAGEPYKT